MYRLRKCLLVILCSSIATYSLPVFAYSVENNANTEALKVELSDEVMSQTVGAGNLDASMVDYKVGGTLAKAAVANRSPINANYTLEVLTPYDNTVLEVLATGVLSPGESRLVTGTPTVTGTQNRSIRIRVSNGFVATNVQDVSIATTSRDSDEDGISDWNEKRYGLNPYDPADALQDADGDTLTNIQEINDLRTDPNNVDTDGDSINDNVELQFGLNPRLAADALLDPDNDFLTNADEILIYNTDPAVADPGLAPDSDGDGVFDTVELALGMDPHDGFVNSVGLDDNARKQVLHVLNRATFGPTSDLVDEVMLTGIHNWIDDQLVSVTLDDGLDPAQALRDNSVSNGGQGAHQVGAIRPVHSIKPLQARMAMFWDNHFSTSITKTGTDAELYEEDLFFENAFGNFRTLLGLSAKGDAMLRYLDLALSNANGPNENYAREVMELYTFGRTIESGIYDANDIAELARILTGWTSNRTAGVTSRYRIYAGGAVLPARTLRTFVFNSSAHDFGEKVYLGQDFPAGIGLAEGERALDIMAAHDATAENICTKLVQHFIADNPAPTTISDCKTTFVAAANDPDQITQVLRGLFNSQEFTDVATQRVKFKDNHEYLTSLARFLGWSAVGTLTAEGRVPGHALGDRIASMGQRQFATPEPTGLPGVVDRWANANNALHRFREGNEMLFNGGNQTQLRNYFTAKGITSSGDILAHTFMLLLGSNYNKEHMVLGYWALHPNNSPFVLNSFSSELRLRNLVARIAQLPEFSAR